MSDEEIKEGDDEVEDDSEDGAEGDSKRDDEGDNDSGEGTGGGGDEIEDDALSSEERKELEALRKKDFNFKKMRDNTKKSKDEVKREKEEVKEEWQEFKENLVKERKEDALSLLVGDDDELRKKVLYNFNRIDPNKPITTKEEIFKRMKEAYSLVPGAREPNIITRGGHSGYRGGSEGESADSKAMRKEMRISDEVKKKYSGEKWDPKF